MTTSPSPPSILVAVDLSDRTAEVLRAAAAVATAAGAPLHIVHAIEASRAEDNTLIVMQQQAREHRQALESAMAGALPAGFKAEVPRVRDGSVADVILKAATETRATLIVLGQHNRRPIADPVLGSTAERVLRSARVPCLLVNGPVELPVRRIMVASDLSDPATHAVGVAAEWSGVLSTGDPVAVEVVSVRSPAPANEQVWRRQETELELRRSVKQAAPGATNVEVTVVEGQDPADVLLDHARSSDAQMVAMATRGDPVVLRAVLGSVSSAMIRKCDLPLLLVPAEMAPARAARIEPLIPTI